MRKDDLTFLKQFVCSFQTTGAVCRTSKKAAHALIEPLLHPVNGSASKQQQQGLRVIELGPGTGSVTVELLKALGPHDELVLCEINEQFMEALKKRLEKTDEYKRHKDRIHFFLGPAQALANDQKFDVVVCCLPFLNLPVEIVTEIFEKIDEVSHPGTITTYYEYVGIRTVGRALSPRVRAIDQYVRTLFTSRRISSRFVIENVPPIKVHTLRA